VPKKSSRLPNPKRVVDRPFKVARRLSDRLGAVPSLIWGVIYLLLIPLYAGFYTLLPRESFYHSTIIHDASYKEEQKAFESDLESWADTMITPRLLDAIEKVESRRPKEIKYYAGFEPGQFWPELYIAADFDNKEHLTYDFYLAAMKHFTLTKDLDYTPPKFTEESSDGFDLTAKCKEDKEAICKSKLVELELKPDKYFIANEDIQERVFQLRSEASGLSYGPDFHTYRRMLYLSAMTVTTVGYGDIVPLTDMARMAVSSEAIFGLVLIGLFLNALAHELHSNNSQSSNS
jgi:hypothetical protein